MDRASEVCARGISSNTMVTFTIIAIVAGAIGGFIHSAFAPTITVQAEAPGVIRATGVELVDSAGNRVGFLGIDESRNIGLSFFDARGKKRTELGLGRGDSPRLDINGPDGHSLLSLDLSQYEKPRLMMSDHDFNARVYLGVVEPDAPDPKWKFDTWVLEFTGDHTRPLATMWMKTSSGGGVAVYDLVGHRWRAPIKE